LQSVSVPCFDNGKVLKITQDSQTSSKWIIEIAIVHIDHIPNFYYQNIMNFAIQSSIWMMQTSITAENIKHLYESIETQVRSKLKSVGSSYKSTLPILRAAHQKNIPFFGICLGMQCAVIEFSRNVLGLKNANSSEFDKETDSPVIYLMPDQKKISDKGGTMRLGKYPCKLKKGTKAYEAYTEDLYIFLLFLLQHFHLNYEAHLLTFPMNVNQLFQI